MQRLGTHWGAQHHPGERSRNAEDLECSTPIALLAPDVLLPPALRCDPAIVFGLSRGAGTAPMEGPVRTHNGASVGVDKGISTRIPPTTQRRRESPKQARSPSDSAPTAAHCRSTSSVHGHFAFHPLDIVLISCLMAPPAGKAAIPQALDRSFRVRSRTKRGHASPPT